MTNESYSFVEKYEYVGRLLRPGEQANSYSDEEDDTPGSESNKNKEFTNVQSSASSASADIKNIDSTETPEKPKDE